MNLFSAKAARSVLATTLLFLVFIITLAASSYVNFNDKKKQLQKDLMQVQANLMDVFNTSEGLMNTLTSFHQASDAYNPSQLMLLTEELLKRHAYLDVILFQNWVDESTQVEFESGIRKSGWPDFSIYSKESKLESQRFLDRSGYITISFIEPLLPTNVFLMGQNLLDFPDYKFQARQAIEQGKIRMFPFDGLLEHKHKCFALLQATYFGFILPETKKDRQQQFDGFFLLFLDMDKILQTIAVADTEHRLQFIFQDQPKESSDFKWFDHVVLNLGFFIPEAGTGIKLTQKYSAGDLVQAPQWFYSALATFVIGFFFLYQKNQLQVRKIIKEAREKLKRERIYAERTLSAISDAVILTDKQGVIKLLNPKAEKLTGMQNKMALGRPLNSVLTLYKDDISNPVDAYSLLIKDELFDQSIYLNLMSPANKTLILEVKVTQVNPLVDDSGRVVVLRDVSLERELTDELTYQATHDNLTGLYNRMAYENQVKTALADNMSSHNPHTALYLDLDRFKLVNDTCGHAAGDELLKIVSGILRTELREQDFLARLGGDEFGVLFWNMPLNPAMEIAERLLKTIRDFRFEWEGKVFEIRASIGLSVVDSDVGALKDVLVAVDLACLSAKEAGRDTIRVYEKDDYAVFNQQEEMNWLPQIHEALEQDRFELHFQPMRPVLNEPDLQPMREILLRMQDKEGQLVLPAQFIPPAERYDVMSKLDRWVIKSLVNYLNSEADKFNGFYSINLSGQSLTEPQMPGYIEQLLSSSDWPAEKICFEITETAAIANLNAAKNFIERVHKLGCSIMLDDFGSGFSSFGYLKALPIDYIKIDGQFVQDIAHDPVDEAMVRMIHEIARVMGIKTIAEFVETEESFKILRDIGIDYIQGYLIARPEPLQNKQRY